MWTERTGRGREGTLAGPARELRDRNRRRHETCSSESKLSNLRSARAETDKKVVAGAVSDGSAETGGVLKNASPTELDITSGPS